MSDTEGSNFMPRRKHSLALFPEYCSNNLDKQAQDFHNDPVFFMILLLLEAEKNEKSTNSGKKLNSFKLMSLDSLGSATS